MVPRKKIPMLGEVITNWRRNHPNLRLGQYFMNEYGINDHDYPDLWEAGETRAKSILLEMYSRYHW